MLQGSAGCRHTDKLQQGESFLKKPKEIEESFLQVSEICVGWQDRMTVFLSRKQTLVTVDILFQSFFFLKS